MKCLVSNNQGIRFSFIFSRGVAVSCFNYSEIVLSAHCLKEQ